MIFHVMSKGNGGQDIFEADSDWREFLSILSKVKARNRFDIFAYCLMPNHFHLLVRVRAASISLIMQHLLTRYSKHFNSRRNRSGHVFQGRFKALLCDRDDYLLELIRYIHLNPVRANLAADAADWPWSGHREFFSNPERRLLDTAYPMRFFGQRPAESIEAYLSFLRIVNHEATSQISERLASTEQEDCGLEEIETREEKSDDERLMEIAVAICDEAAIPIEDLRGSPRRSEVSNVRRFFIQRSAERGIRPSRIAAFINRSPAAVSKVINPG